EHKAEYPKKPVIQKYYYYPKIQAYYNPAEKIYFFRKDGNWKKAAHLPEDLHVRQGKPVTVNLDTDTPYIYFDEHKAKYPKKPVVQKPVIQKYYYYPKIQAYYNPAEKKYFFRKDGQWKKAAHLPEDLHVRQGKPVTVNLDTDTPYIYFDEHKAKYPIKPVAQKPVIQKKVYKFFPTLRVYYDPTNKVWFRLEGSTWKETTQPPSNITNKKEFTIQLDSDKPYQFFEIHKKKYGEGNPPR
ncbi:MAG: hypothetical protein B6I30_08910, partial [Desulfobacteraceae bacterium 4572_187]